MIKQDNFSLRLIEESDLGFLKQLRNDPSTYSYLGTFAFLNEASQRNWFERINRDSSCQYFVFEVSDDSTTQRAGMVRMTSIDNVNRSVNIGGDIVPEMRGKGYAKNMYNLVFELGFMFMNMNRLWLMVMDNNDVAISLYKKLGFVEEGKQRQAIFRNGQYYDYIMMSMLYDEYVGNKEG